MFLLEAARFGVSIWSCVDSCTALHDGATMKRQANAGTALPLGPWMRMLDAVPFLHVLAMQRRSHRVR